MNYKDILKNARENLNGSCRVCRVCNGKPVVVKYLVWAVKVQEMHLL